MKIFSFKRLLGMAAIYGAVRYVRANGGPKAVFDDLSSKARGLMDDAKAKMSDVKNEVDNKFATNSGRNGMSESSSGRGSSYASYDLDAEDKLRH